MLDFESLDRPALRALPSVAYEYAEFKRVRANIDDHVENEAHCYSVPCSLHGRVLELRATAATVEILYHPEADRGARAELEASAASTTGVERMPRAHRAHAERMPSRPISWARTIGRARRSWSRS